ncbi:hypothetical protein CDO52_00825 [Nocardiopsis gilva YIM 90087]|uniref:Uncharacterized protein n=1 Tax=Nocardiopsis gilva YIM 90087 TaxID=1235441 RepID=A0A223S066_9ACTN|nr:hypothetical protein [Nocardiopsis gilva]ASU81522.1 hypothetical protein CDO52_00825 [Nocardiopsis gilva YIM 90087]
MSTPEETIERITALQEAWESRPDSMRWRPVDTDLDTVGLPVEPAPEEEPVQADVPSDCSRCGRVCCDGREDCTVPTALLLGDLDRRVPAERRALAYAHLHIAPDTDARLTLQHAREYLAEALENLVGTSGLEIAYQVEPAGPRTARGTSVLAIAHEPFHPYRLRRTGISGICGARPGRVEIDGVDLTDCVAHVDVCTADLEQ